MKLNEEQKGLLLTCLANFLSGIFTLIFLAGITVIPSRTTLILATVLSGFVMFATLIFDVIVIKNGLASIVRKRKHEMES